MVRAPAFKMIAILGCIVAARVDAVAENEMVLGPAQFAEDKTGAGAVLCLWSIYLSVQAAASACGVEREPVDDAIDKAIGEIDKFIIPNSSLHPTEEMLEAFKKRAKEVQLKGLGQGSQKEKFCKGDMLRRFRDPSSEQIDASTKKLLAIPREPVMNPCL